MHHSPCLSILELGLKNQLLIARCLDMGLAEQAQMLRHIDERLIWQLKAEERLSEEEQRAQGFTHYIWRTQGDEKVRPEHAANDGQVFAWDDPPPTGHPGADYGCRCWAQPLDGAEPVYPLETLLGGLATGAGRAVLREILRRVGGAGQVEEATEDESVNKPAPAEQDRLKKPEGVPKDWKESPSRNEKGVRYRDPKNIHNEVRVQKGRPEVSNPSQQKDYVRWKKDGQWLDKNGKPSIEAEKTHIPVEEFEFKPEIFE